jgi:hypothetical protein
MWYEGADSWFRIGSVMTFCAHANEPSGSIEVKELVNHLKEYLL